MTIPPDIDEKTFQATVIELAKVNGWLVHHNFAAWRSRGSAGFPDLAMLRGGRIIFAELKTASGELSTEQEAWLRALAGTGGNMLVHVWQPADWDVIEKVLT